MKTKVFYGTDPDSKDGFFWPNSKAKRAELMTVKRNRPGVYESVYQCRPGQRQGAIFLQKDMAYYKPPQHLSLGTNHSSVLEFCSRFQMIVGGWDTAYEASSDSDHTVGIVAGLLPCDQYHCGEDPNVIGECDAHFDVYLLDLFRDKIQWGDLVAEFRRMNMKWHPELHVVEKRASGISLYQSLPQAGINVEGVMTVESKKARAVSGTEAGSVQGWFRQHRVLLPIGAPWLDAYVLEMKDFTGDDDSPDDQVDATVHLVNFAIQSGAGFALLPSDWTPERIDVVFEEQSQLSMQALRQSAGSMEMLNFLRMAPELSDDPFAMMCGRCEHHTGNYCSRHKHSATSFDSCYDFTERS